MYTGTLIDDLMAAVERAEERTQLAAQDDRKYLLVPTLYEMGKTEQNLQGAA
jgi:hypothetical protein